jgi:hypothetical protein
MIVAPQRAANRAYGQRAVEWASRLPESLGLVATDLTNVTQAFADAAARRKVGERFLASVFIDDRRAQCALVTAAPVVLAQVADYDARLSLMEAVAGRGISFDGKPQIDFETLDTRYLRASVELLATADAVVVRSSVERERLFASLKRSFLHVAPAAPLDPRVPLPPGGAREAGRSIVVWAPDLAAEACGLFAFALEEFKRPAIVVCASGQPAHMRAGTRFVGLGDASAALAEAAVIVDATLTDPGTARALARWRVPLAAASTAGALDYLDGITVFEPWSFRSVAAAVSNALGYRAPRERAAQRDDVRELEEALAWATPAPPTAGPLVSVVVPTMNGRPSLVDAVASIAAQTYGNLEIIVVNDGGPPIVTDLPGSPRIIEYPDNRGACGALNVGIAAATGKYIALLADDDLFCPDHIARLVEPLERTGGDIAHTIELAEHFERAADGSLTLFGHSHIMGDPVSPSLLLVFNFIGGPSIMFSRAVFERVGPFDARAGHLCDLEMWIRMSAYYDFAHVDRVTTVMSMRSDASQASAISGAETAAIYAAIYALHPTGLPSIQRRRETHLRGVEGIAQVNTLPQLRLT